MSEQDLSTMRLAFKFQTDPVTPALGTDGFALDVLPSTGLAIAIAAIESGLISSNRMKRRARQGPKTVTAAYETELSCVALDPIVSAVLGAEQTPKQSFSNLDWGALTISGTGVTGTFATGTLLDDKITPGMFVRFTDLSVGANNGIWVPILDVTSAGTLQFAPGYLTDSVSDAEYGVEIAAYTATGANYLDQYVSAEEFMPDTAVAMSKYGIGMRFHSLNISVDPKAYLKVGFDLTGRDMHLMTAPNSPVFTAPIRTHRDSLILLDGGLYVGGVKRLNLTSLKFGLAAPASTTDVIGTNVSPKISLGQFAFTGDFTGIVADESDFRTFDEQTDVTILLHCKEKSTNAFVSFFIGYASFGSYSTPMGGEGLLIQSLSLFAGEDVAPNHNPSVILVSTSPD